jgi:Fe-S cluster assembly protein SufD
MPLKTDTPLDEARDALLALAEAAKVPAPLEKLRQEGLSRFAEVGLPGPREEAWRFLNLRGFLKQRFEAPAPVAAGKAREAFELFTFEGLEACRLVFVNGRFSPELSEHTVLPDGTIVCSLNEALERDREAVLADLGQHAGVDRTPFAALNSATLLDGAFISVPRDTALEMPIHVVHLTVGPQPIVTSPRTLMLVGSGAKATLIESFGGHDTQAYFTNAVSEYVVGENAHLSHLKLQREGDEAFHVATHHAHLVGACDHKSINISLGAQLTRNDMGARIDGDGAHAALDGLNLVGGTQWVDNHTLLDHTTPHCTSHQLYKSVLDDQATTVFNGRIVVHRPAQKTDAIQSNHSLLLSDRATAHTQPNLEIFADDVKCTHGATVGNLDKTQLFYLRSRGIGEETARGLLTFAFANEIIEEIDVPPIREQLERHIYARFNRA